MKTRILMTRRGCAFCRDAIRVVNKLNLHFPIEKKIRIIDCWEYEEFGLNNIPLINKLHKDGLKEGFPFLYIDGIIIEPAPTPKQLKILLTSFLQEDFVI